MSYHFRQLPSLAWYAFSSLERNATGRSAWCPLGFLQQSTTHLPPKNGLWMAMGTYLPSFALWKNGDLLGIPMVYSIHWYTSFSNEPIGLLMRPCATADDPVSAKALWTSITSLPGRSDLADVWDLPRFGILRKCPKVGKKNRFKLWFQYVSLGFLKISKVFRPFDAFWKVCWKRNALEKPWRQLPMKQDQCKQLKLTPSRDLTRALGLVQVLRCLRGLGELFRLVCWNPLVLGGPLGHFRTIPLGPIFRLDLLSKSCAMYRNLLWCIQPPAAWRTENPGSSCWARSGWTWFVQSFFHPHGVKINATKPHKHPQHALHCHQDRHHVGLPNSSPPLPTQSPPSCCPLRRSFVPRPCGASCLAARAAGDAKTSPQIWSSLACSAPKKRSSWMEKNMISNRAYFFIC